jgi:molybdopterin-guanine dinucleotide biosynthesis protein
MKTIIVSGASSTAAKTTLAEAVLSKLRGRAWGGVKITVTHDIVQGCPRGGSGCGVCASVPTGYRVMTDPETIAQPRTDTGRLTAAGADPVVWLITTPAFVRVGWEDVRRRFGPVDGVVVESNSLALCLKPDLTFFTINPRVPRSRWKASAPILIEQSDVVIISLHDTGREQAQELIADIETKRQGHGVIITEAVEQAVDMPEVSQRLQTLLK